MFEHAGVSNSGDYFNQVRELLSADGIAVNHSMGVHGSSKASQSLIAKIYFPGRLSAIARPDGCSNQNAEAENT